MRHFNIKAFSGYAIHKRITECHDQSTEYIFVEMNTEFEKISGLHRTNVMGKKIGDVLKENGSMKFDWYGLYADILHSRNSNIEYFSSLLEKWFRVNVILLDDNYFITQFFDITEYKNKISETERELGIYKNVINGANVGIWEWNVQTGEQTINERWAEIIGYTLDELSPVSIETWRRLVHPEDLERVDRELAETFWKTIGHYVLFFRMQHKKGHWVWIESNGAVNSWTLDGNPLCISGSHVDISKRKLAEDAVRDNERRLKATQEVAHIGNWEIDLKTMKIWASEEAFKIYGIKRITDEFDLKIIQGMAKTEYRKCLDDALINLIIRNEKYDIEFKIINGFTKEEIAIHSKAILQKDGHGEPIRVIGTIQDITEEKKRQEELIYLGYHDQLTGLYNRRFFNEEIIRIDRYENLPITIVQCDVNGLKMINDAFGHNLGDALLKKVADILDIACGDDVLVSRYGGDEFAIILLNTCMDEGKRMIKRIKELLANERVGAFDISVSFGIETKCDPRQDIHIVSKNAEDNMYKHKLYERSSVRSKTVDLIINTLYEKNNREMLHSKRVSSLCESFANYLNINKDMVNKIKVAGLMHDIGKIGIDEKILNKRKPLDDNEWNEIKRHSEIGFRILSSVNEFSEIANSVLEHQEKWDGSGYPKGLRGEEISLEARIIAIVDAYDAMTGNRTYGQVLTRDEALMEISRCKGTQFDPQLAEFFLEMFNEN